MVTRVTVEPTILVWARERSCLTIDDAAKLLCCPSNKLEEIERGEVAPVVTLFRKMASVYLVPEATLLGLDRPPADRPLPKDFRSFDGIHVRFSYATVAAIRNVEARQDALAELAELDGDIIAPIIPQRSLHDNAEKLGDAFRKELSFSIIDQMRARPDQAFLRWRLLIERMGVAVYLEPLGDDTSRGASIFHNEFPAIIVDQNEKQYGARSFTLFHEYAHLLIRQAGISGFNPRSRVEAFCNRFASAVLLPREAVEAVFKINIEGRSDPTLAQMKDAAHKLCVTISQLALRLEALGLVNDGFYSRIKSPLAVPTKKRGGGGLDTFKYAYLSRFGHHLPEVVFGSFDRGYLSQVGVSRILQVSPSHFAPLRKIIADRADRGTD